MERIIARTEACYVKAEQFFQRTFARPDIHLDLRGQRAGVAYLDRNLLRFNGQMYRENSAHFLQQTVAHEVAHLKEPHHGASFWETVAVLDPNMDEGRKWLREHGETLHFIG